MNNQFVDSHPSGGHIPSRYDCEGYEYHIMVDEDCDDILDEYIEIKRQEFHKEWLQYLDDERD